MALNSAIEWTDATWNPVTGCVEVSPGCDHCYAKVFAERWRGIPGHHYEQGFDLKLWPERLNLPLQWKKPRRIFVNSMSDLFHKDVPNDFIHQVFDVMTRATQHNFQILTKRPRRLERYTTEFWPNLAEHQHIWLGTSIEDNTYTWRANHLRRTPAAVRFISAEPLLGPLDGLDLTDIHWLIAGGESGVGHRPCDPAWVRLLRQQCQDTSVAFFFKQWGGQTSKAGGRHLDGRTWDEFPAPAILQK
jgi:protein gp37